MISNRFKVISNIEKYVALTSYLPSNITIPDDIYKELNFPHTVMGINIQGDSLYNKSFKITSHSLELYIEDFIPQIEKSPLPKNLFIKEE